MTVLAEGKTKKIESHDSDPTLAYMVSKDDITAGNGARRDVIQGKAELSTRTTVNVMTYLKSQGYPTAFIRQVDPVTQLVHRCTMIPIECVARGVAFGSYLKRNTHVEEGKVFSEPITEMFYKDDSMDDPLMVLHSMDLVHLHDAARPISPDTKVGELDLKEFLEKIGWRFTGVELFRILNDHTANIFRTLSSKWREQDVLLVDMKIEFGIDVATGSIMLADVIDNDSWRCWPKGDKAEMLDKQVYRDMKIATPQALESFKGKLKEVAERTDHFF